MMVERARLAAGVPVVRLAPAKLNLTLAILGRRGDGFHEIHSVMVPLALTDRLSVAPAAGPQDSLRVDGFPTAPAAENLVLRAIAAVRAELRRQGRGGMLAGLPGLAARLEKRIPVAAGLGGGSSDAAAALDAALEAWDERLDDIDRLRLAASLGSDVPFFLAASGPQAVPAPVLVEGRGERVTPLRPIRPGPDGPPGILIVTPAIPVSTPDVFAAYDAGHRPGAGARAASAHLAAELQRGLTAEAFVARAAVLASANDLIPAAFALVPELVRVRRGLTRLLRRPVGQSGSGPTCWVLYPSLGAAHEAADAVHSALEHRELSFPGAGAPAILATTLAGAAVPGTTKEEGSS